MKRLFIAIPLSEEMKKKIKQVQDELRLLGRGAKLVNEENLHLTVTFLGNVSDNKIHLVEKKIKQVFLGQMSFHFSLQGMGIFAQKNHPRIVWVGVTSPGLLDLKSKVNQNLSFIGKEEREDIPHLTIIRIKSEVNKDQLNEILQKYKDKKFGEMMVKQVVLYESKLTPEGPIYKVVKEFVLSGS